jgi:hypothetical protein
MKLNTDFSESVADWNLYLSRARHFTGNTYWLYPKVGHVRFEGQMGPFFSRPLEGLFSTSGLSLDCYEISKIQVLWGAVLLYRRYRKKFVICKVVHVFKVWPIDLLFFIIQKYF